MMQGVYNVKIRRQEVYSSKRWHQLGDSPSLLCDGNQEGFSPEAKRPKREADYNPHPISKIGKFPQQRVVEENKKLISFLLLYTLPTTLRYYDIHVI